MNKLINDDDDGTQEIAILFIIKQREPLLRIRKALGGGGGGLMDLTVGILASTQRLGGGPSPKVEAPVRQNKERGVHQGNALFP